MGEQRQHEPAPATRAEFRALVDDGLLITTGGKTLVRRPCPRCGSLLLGSVDGAETCWCIFTCPACSATPGQRCRRPSEHAVFGNRPHGSRVNLALADTERRAQAGDPDLPACWPPQSASTSSVEQPTLW